MRSKLFILLMIVISLALVGQAFGATIAAYPTKVPKGAYVNGPGGVDDDNFYWQMVTITMAAAHAANQTITVTLPDGMTIADADGDASNWIEEVSYTFTDALGTNVEFATTPPTSAAGADMVFTMKTGGFSATDVLRLFVPVVTSAAPADSTQDWYVTFSDNATDGLANGSGAFITYVSPGPKTLQLVSFDAILTANDDSTSKKGDRYPSTAAATFGALPDFIIDGGATFASSANRAAEYGFPALNGAENGNETVFAVWVSTDSTLAHVDSLTAGVFHAADYTTKIKVSQTEGGTGLLRYDMGGYPEGKYYFYITSYLTGNFPLARSDGLVVRHWPVTNATGFDRNHNTFYAAGGADDDALTLDSGGYYDYTGTAAGTNTYTYVDIFANVDDLDDDAKVHLFYSSNSALVDSNVVTTGSGGAGTLAITGITGASAIKMNLHENSKDEQGFIRQRWETSPDSIAVISAAALTVYTVVCDGKHFELSKLQGTAAVPLPEITQGAAVLPINIKHSPKLVLDGLGEYETTPTGTYDIDVSTVDQIMISWGKTGTAGDVDADDDAIIDFYIIPKSDNTNGNLEAGDFNHNEATGVRTAANGHKINVTALQEKYEGKENSWFKWDLKQDFLTSGWSPTNGIQYILYAVISENKSVGNTEIVYTFGDTFLSAVEAVQTVTFYNTPFTRLSGPPAEGITLNAEETYRLPITAFDYNSGTIGIYLVNSAVAGFTNGPMITTATTIAALANGNAYCLTDDDGDPAAGASYLASTVAYYDMTIRPPVAGGTVKYLSSMNGGIDLADATYWVYIGKAPSTVINGTFTGNATGWTVAANWSYVTDTVVHAASAVGTLEQTVPIIAGQSYSVTFTIGVWTSGTTITPYLGGTAGTPRSSAATFTETIVAGSADSKLKLVATADVVATGVDNILLAGTLYRAPGPLTVVNAGVASVQRNLSLTPMEANAAQGDTLTFIVKAADNGATVDRMDFFVSVDKTWWTLVSESTPFTAASGYAGKLIANTATNDSTNNRWILRAVAFDAGATFGIMSTGLGDDVASFRLVSKGTTDAINHVTSVGFVNDPGHNWVTKFSNDGVDQSINTLSSTVKVVPRGIIDGIVELQGRAQMNATFTFELRKRGGYEPITDALFLSTNDDAAGTAGLQIIPDTDGKFTLFKVPTGEYDLVAKYDRYLSKKVQVNVYPGIDTLFVSFGQLKGGDCFGYSDSLKYVYPNNKVDIGDLNRVSTAFLATSANAKWTNGTDNWKWADINEDGIVETDDLALTTANQGQPGAQPVYKPAELPGLSNSGAIVEFMNVPSELRAGETYTIQVVARNTAAIRAYFVNMRYDAAALSFSGIRKGGFIEANSHSFPVMGDGTVGLANSVFGDVLTSGDGVLAEVSFTARANGMFDAGMLKFEEISLVNGEFVKENLVFGQTAAGGKTPLTFALGQNFPNPFNPTTVIGFSIPESGSVSFMVYDILGRHVRTLVSQPYQSGRHSVVWDGRDDSGNMVSAGVYVYTIKSGKFSATKKMLFMK